MTSQGHNELIPNSLLLSNEDVMTWTYFPHNLPFVRGVNQLLVDSSTEVHWCRALLISFLLAWISCGTNSRVAHHLKGYKARMRMIMCNANSAFHHIIKKKTVCMENGIWYDINIYLPAGPRYKRLKVWISLSFFNILYVSASNKTWDGLS